jgi:hypothetical protein
MANSKISSAPLCVTALLHVEADRVHSSDQKKSAQHKCGALVSTGASWRQWRVLTHRPYHQGRHKCQIVVAHTKANAWQ